MTAVLGGFEAKKVAECLHFQKNPSSNSESEPKQEFKYKGKTR